MGSGWLAMKINNNALVVVLMMAVIYNFYVSAGITTTGREFSVNEGNSVELPCNVKDLDDDTVVIWKRGEEIIFTDEYSTIEDARFQLNHENDNFTLIIDRVEPYDTAAYICSITSPEQSITHHLQVNVPPSILISPDSNPLLVGVDDENVIIKCTASGNPAPKVSWSKKNGKLRANSISKDGQLRLMKVTPEDSGIYECAASNGVGADAHDTIEVRVQSGQTDAHEPSAPWVDADYSYLPVRLDHDINVTCKYNAEPAPQVDWLYNAFTINFSDNKFKGTVQYGTRRDNYSESILAIKNIKEDNFGDYSCRISNNLGTVEKTIHISGRPGPPTLSVSGNQLSWTVQSVDPIIEYQILYRFSHEDTWQQFKSIRAEKEEQNGNEWSRSEQLVWLRPDTDYELQLKARNTLGWGSLARQYITLRTPSNNNETNREFDKLQINNEKYAENCLTAVLFVCLFVFSTDSGEKQPSSASLATRGSSEAISTIIAVMMLISSWYYHG
ncbi:unnamed protein product [Anisakis simplex]|uniref:Neurotrimin n=1 Tax=Anisakis simplex TaxID=6269 RepID=A0A0M3JQT8_ANISI|nr:unnamed protein product [Anisakis simplex]